MTSTKNTKLTAAVVSRKLKAEGFLPLPSGTPRGREGIRVGKSVVGVHVEVDLDLPGQMRRMTDAVEQALRRLGYSVRRPDGGEHLYVEAG